MSELFTPQRLERQLFDVKDTLQDILHLAQLNLKSLDMVMQEPSGLSNLLGQIDQLVLDFQASMFQCLVAEQIKLQDIHLRRERMTEYEDQIQERRRAVADKQSVYQTMTNAKRKRNLLLRPEDYERVRNLDKLRDDIWYSAEHLRSLEQTSVLLQYVRRFNEKLSERICKLEDLSRFSRKFVKWIISILQDEQSYKLLKDQPLEQLFQNFANDIEGMMISQKSYTTINYADQVSKIAQLRKQQMFLAQKLKDEREMTNFLQLENKSLIDRYRVLGVVQNIPKQKQKRCSNESTACN